MVIVDFKKGDLPVGPPDAMKLALDQVRLEFTDAGHVPTRAVDELAYQYLVVFASAGTESP